MYTVTILYVVTFINSVFTGLLRVVARSVRRTAGLWEAEPPCPWRAAAAATLTVSVTVLRRNRRNHGLEVEGRVTWRIHATAMRRSIQILGVSRLLHGTGSSFVCKRHAEQAEFLQRYEDEGRERAHPENLRHGK